MPSNQSPHVTLFGDTVEYRVVESDDATQPRIDVDIHEVKVVLPSGSDVDPENLLQENAKWVVEKKRKFDSYRDQTPSRNFVEGASWPYLGESRELSVESVEEHHVADETLILSKVPVEATSIKSELESFYRQEARTHLQERIQHYSERMGVEPRQLELRNQRTRWASCSPNQTLSFNWRLIMAPPDIIDYIVVHELAHLQEQNHTNRFWDIVSQYDPDYQDHAEWLKENSPKLIFTDDDL